MAIFKSNLILLILAFVSLQKISAHNDTANFQIIVPDNSTIKQQNKTIDKLVEEQTDLIRRIVSSQKVTTTSEQPIILTNKKVDTKLKEEKEKQSIEELRRRCQLLFELSMRNNITEFKEDINKEKISTVEAFGPNKKPEFLQKTTKIESSTEDFSKQIEQSTMKYFFITRNQTNVANKIVTVHNDKKEDDSALLEIKTVNNPNLSTVNTLKLQQQSPQIQQHTLDHQNIKYTHLEPVILQKMMLNNGRMVFYWYKSIPAIPQVVSVPIQTQQPNIYKPQTYSTQNLNYLPQNYQENYSTTEEKTSSEMLPKYEVDYGTTTEKPDDNLYRKQLKFVIPVPYPTTAPVGSEGEVSRQYPWQFDPYAYYPRPLQPSTINVPVPSLQPSTINVPVPYLPTFHMIKTIRVPENGNILRNNSYQ